MSLKQALQSLREGTHGSVTSNKRDNGGLSGPPQMKYSVNYYYNVCTYVCQSSSNLFIDWTCFYFEFK